MKCYIVTLLVVCASVTMIFTASGCGGGGGGTPAPVAVAKPAISASAPASGALVKDVDFIDDSFVVKFSYTSGASLDQSKLFVTLSMDGGADADVTKYFSFSGSNSIQSSGISEYTSSLFQIQSNVQTYTMTLKAGIEDVDGATATVSSSFTVYPDVP